MIKFWIVTISLLSHLLTKTQSFNDAGDLTLDASSGEAMNTAMEESSQLEISPEISEAEKQKHLMELEAQLHFNKAMSGIETEDLKNLNKENKSERHDDCTSSVSSGDHINWGNSVELNSHSSRSQKSESRCSDS